MFALSPKPLPERLLSIICGYALEFGALQANGAANEYPEGLEHILRMETAAVVYPRPSSQGMISMASPYEKKR